MRSCKGIGPSGGLGRNDRCRVSHASRMEARAQMTNYDWFGEYMPVLWLHIVSRTFDADGNKIVCCIALNEF